MLSENITLVSIHPLSLLSVNAQRPRQMAECNEVLAARTAVGCDACPQSSSNGAGSYRGLTMPLVPVIGRRPLLTCSHRRSSAATRLPLPWLLSCHGAGASSALRAQVLLSNTVYFR